MDRIEELIRFSNESEEVDFKAQEFRREQFAELIKDVLAFSNAAFKGDRFIIIGVKKVDGEPVIYPIESTFDAANIQQLIHENIFPGVKVSYDPFNFEGANLVVLTIHNPVDQPYMILKNYPVQNGKGLIKHEM